MANRKDPQPRPAELSALADGSLAPHRRAALEREVAASASLHELLEREREALGAVRSIAAGQAAPPRLRARVEAERRRRTDRGARRGRGLALAGGMALLVLLVVLLLPAGNPGAPSVSEAAALWSRGPAGPPPAPDPSGSTAELAAAGHRDIYFPDWSRSLGWRAVGARSDELHGRRALTVFYARGAQRVAYTIVGGPTLAQPSVAPLSLGGYSLRTLRQDRRIVVTWRRGGHTCVLSGAKVKVATLHRLAAWRVV